MPGRVAAGVTTTTTTAAPVIYAVRDVPTPGRGGRVVAALVAVGCLAVLVCAATLEPSPTGVGTHTAMGLTRCAFHDRTNLPCPSCGMTTSFAWFAHGNLAASAYVQPMGALLALATAACVVGGLYVAATGRPVYRLLRLIPSRYYVLPVMLFAVLAWAWKIFIRLRGIDGWG